MDGRTESTVRVSCRFHGTETLTTAEVLSSGTGVLSAARVRLVRRTLCPEESKTGPRGRGSARGSPCHCLLDTLQVKGARVRRGSYGELYLEPLVRWYFAPCLGGQTRGTGFTPGEAIRCAKAAALEFARSPEGKAASLSRGFGGHITVILMEPDSESLATIPPSRLVYLARLDQRGEFTDTLYPGDPNPPAGAESPEGESEPDPEGESEPPEPPGTRPAPSKPRTR